MVKVAVAAELPMGADDYFREHESAAFRALLCKALNFTAMTFERSWEDPERDATWVELHTEPNMDNMPRALQGMVGVFVDELCFERGKVAGPTYEMLVISRLPFLKDHQYDIKNTLNIKPLGKGRCRQSLTGHVEIKVFGLGGIIQGVVVSSLRQAYAVLPEVVERWVEFREKAMATEEGRASLLNGRPDIATVPREALEAMQRPYSELEVPEQQQQQEEEDGQQQKRAPKMGEMRTETGIYFDAAEFFAVDDASMDDQTRAAVESDKLALLELANCGGVHPLELVCGEEAGGAADAKPGKSVKPKRKLISLPSGATPKALLPTTMRATDWNETCRNWARFWDEVGIAKPKMPNYSSRVRELLGSMDKLGMVQVKRSVGKSLSLGGTGGKKAVGAAASITKGVVGGVAGGVAGMANTLGRVLTLGGSGDKLSRKDSKAASEKQTSEQD